LDGFGFDAFGASDEPSGKEKGEGVEEDSEDQPAERESEDLGFGEFGEIEVDEGETEEDDGKRGGDFVAEV
jgi:hypothetical protein